LLDCNQVVELVPRQSTAAGERRLRQTVALKPEGGGGQRERLQQVAGEPAVVLRFKKAIEN
jgi:hypothetical protein